MTCQEIADFLMEYLNGDLADSQRVTFEEHLRECPDCVAYLQSYEMTVKLSQGTRTALSSDAPEHLIHAILATRRNQTK